jgi:hypothetical protein
MGIGIEAQAASISIPAVSNSWVSLFLYQACTGISIFCHSMSDAGQSGVLA